MNFEQGAQGIEALHSWSRDNDQSLTRNEATTRLHLIDRLFFDCLGWLREDGSAEVYENGAFADYQFGKPGVKLLVEAKREGTYFMLPAGWTEPICELATLFVDGPDIENAIDQALGYALQRGIPVAAVCNGWQLIAFLASRTDGIPPRRGRALVFPDVDAMRDRFRLLWDNLSKSALDSLNIAHSLRLAPRLVPPPKLSAHLQDYPGMALRNDLQQNLQILGEIFVEDLVALQEDEEDFLRQCYASSGALSKYALVSREILRTRYSLLFEQDIDYSTIPAVDETGIDTSLLTDIVAASVKHRPIILLGDVGVGKSTFIRNLIHIDAKEQLKYAIVLYLDFGKKPALALDLDQHVRTEIERQLLRRYNIDVHSEPLVRGIYHGKLEQFRGSIYGGLRETAPQEFAREELKFLDSLVSDVDEHLRNTLEHITKARRQQVVIFLDNIDQRDPSFQDRLFVIAQTIAESWPATVFIAIRPDTFHKSRREGSLSAYQPRAFTISPPRVDVVVRKRLAFALRKLQSQGLYTAGGTGLGDTSTLKSYLRVIADSLERNDDLTEFLENASRGNIREALSFLETFIGSGHVDTKKILTFARPSGRGYRIPLHEFLRAVLYGDTRYYSPDRSPIGNLFDIQEAIAEEHFLTPLLVGFLHRQAGKSLKDGFVETRYLFSVGQDLGFRPDQIAAALDRGHQSRFIQPSGFQSDSASGQPACRVTTLGVYAIHRLARSFVYHDAVVVDTPILDIEARSQIDDISPFGHVDERLKRAEVFSDYLSHCWRPLAGKALPFDWDTSFTSLRREVDRIRLRPS